MALELEPLKHICRGQSRLETMDTTSKDLVMDEVLVAEEWKEDVISLDDNHGSFKRVIDLQIKGDSQRDDKQSPLAPEVREVLEAQRSMQRHSFQGEYQGDEELVVT